MKRYLSLAAVGVAAVLALASCGSDAGGTAAAHNDADVTFAQMMIPHHQQAVQMSEIMLAKEDTDRELTELATEIKEAQAPEIETMTDWLEAWGEPVDPEGGMEGHDMGSMDNTEGMAGMMNDAELAELDSADGEAAARTFLQAMTAHHNGAVDMAQEEIENGENVEAIALAETIVDTQQAEIQEMEELLAGL